MRKQINIDSREISAIQKSLRIAMERLGTADIERIVKVCKRWDCAKYQKTYKGGNNDEKDNRN